jgi:uncharacterized membrane protein
VEKLIKPARLFYAIALVAYAVRQFIYADFRPAFTPPWPAWLPGGAIAAYIFGALLFAAGIAIALDKKGREVALVLGGIFLALFCLWQVPYELFFFYWRHLGAWADALKEIAFAGGAFIVAWSFPVKDEAAPKNAVIRFLEKLIPFGAILFSITMVAFGIAHCMYADNIQTLVPAYFPDHLFWTYFAAVALIGSGVSFILKIRMKRVAVLYGIMVLIWCLILHTPGAIADPHSGNGNLVVSAFDALLFSGVGFLIAAGYYKKAF